MEKKQARRTGRKPKTDPADYKYNFRLNAQEKSRFERLFLESGARDRTIFIKKSRWTRFPWTITSGSGNFTDNSRQ